MDEKKSKKILLVITFLILFILITKCSIVFASSVNVKTQTSQFYVNDFANIFSDEQEQTLMQKAVELEESYNGIQVVVTTINSLEGSSAQEYAYAMYNQYGIGKDSMGILILLATEDREVRIETGFKMQTYITDSLSGRILDKYGMDYLKDNKFAEGLISIQGAVIDEIKERVPNNWHEENIQSNTSTFDFGSFMLNLLLFIVLPAGIIVLIVFVVKKISQAKEAKIQSIIAENDKKWNKVIEAKEAEFNNDIEQIKYDRARAERETMILENKNQKLSNELEKMNSKYERIKKLHPNIETEIYQMIQEEFKDEAQKYDLQYKEMLQIKPSIKNKEKINKAIKAFESLSAEAKRYSKTDIEALKKIYRDCEYLEDIAIAGSAHDKISHFLDTNVKADYKNYLKIAEMFAIYAGLTAIQKQYLDNRDTTLINRLTSMKNTAEDDYQDYNLAQRVQKSMSNTIESIYSPDRYDINEIESEINNYEALTQNQKSFIPIDLFEKLKSMLKKAQDDEEDYERRKREQERIASARRASSSSIRHTSSFSGHGGRSGGGGAGRRF